MHFVPRGLTISVGPAHAGPAFHSAFAPGDVVYLTDAAAVVATVTSKLRARRPVLAYAPSADVRAALCAAADRFGAPKTALCADVTVLDGEDFDLVVDPAEELLALWGDLSHLVNVDVIGDVHGQHRALDALLHELGYRGRLGDDGFNHEDGRLLVFVGDLIDKGPEPLRVLRQAMAATRKGQAIVVRGNHEHKLSKTLSNIGSQATSATQWRRLLLAEVDDARWGRKRTLEQLADDADGIRNAFATEREWLSSLPLLAEVGGLHVVHAAFDPSVLDMGNSPKERRQAERWLLHGGPNTTRPSKGETDGRVKRPAWVEHHQGEYIVVHGHDSVLAPTVFTNAHGGKAISVDTGAGDGHDLSALRWDGHSPAFVTVAV